MILRRTASVACIALSVFASASQASAQHTEARQWNELLLDSIRNDFARPTVHARNLYHISCAMWDAWATYDGNADCVLFSESHPTTDPAIDAWRSEALSYATYRILSVRFQNSPGGPTMLPQYDALMTALGYSPANTSTAGVSPACLLYTSPSPRDKRQSRMPSSA